ncbi:MAG: DUF5685 family protein [Clostridiales bacterium]|nr:DUF5685 family protein [Clostridiales bacterium]
MFGYIVTNRKTLSKDELMRYKSAYCGLCRQLRLSYGNAGRSALSYDLTFVALLLSSLYELPEEAGFERCFARPARRHPYIATEATAYAADMNVLLAYYQALDDWNDDRSQAALGSSRRLGEFLPGIEAKWPDQCANTARCMAELAEIEKGNELNPDVPLNCFGQLMGGLLAWRQDGRADSLRKIGAALGRYVYLLDANNDLTADIRKERYNPLIALLRADFKPLLTLMIGECTAEFESLGLSRDIHLLRNILYSGVWLRYRPNPHHGGAGGGADA